MILVVVVGRNQAALGVKQKTRVTEFGIVGMCAFGPYRTVRHYVWTTGDAIFRASVDTPNGWPLV